MPDNNSIIKYPDMAFVKQKLHKSGGKDLFAKILSALSSLPISNHGIGLADITTKRLVNALDFKKTYTNAITAISPEKAAIPIHFDTDRESLEACSKTIGLNSTEEARIVRIKDTATLELLQVSKALLPDILSNPNLKQITEWTPFQFDNNGNLPELSSLLSR